LWIGNRASRKSESESGAGGKKSRLCGCDDWQIHSPEIDLKSNIQVSVFSGRRALCCVKTLLEFLVSAGNPNPSGWGDKKSAGGTKKVRFLAGGFGAH
jgi:hypothetical protein